MTAASTRKTETDEGSDERESVVETARRHLEPDHHRRRRGLRGTRRPGAPGLPRERGRRDGVVLRVASSVSGTSTAGSGRWSASTGSRIRDARRREVVRWEVDRRDLPWRDAAYVVALERVSEAHEPHEARGVRP
jgi:hypothetical protein